MELASLIASAVLLAPASSSEAQPAAHRPPERIVLPVIQPGCDRSGEADVVTVCGRSDRRFRIDPGTLQTILAIEDRDDLEKRIRPDAITRSCDGIGPMAHCSGNIPVSDMALRAISLIVKAVRGEDLRPALRKGPSDYEIYQRSHGESEARAKE